MYSPQTPGRLNILTPADDGYEFWNGRSANLRMKGNPSRIIPVRSIPELVTALQETVNSNRRLAIRGGGHCLENFVSHNSVEVIIDISMIKGIRYDEKFNAIEISAGITLGEMHEKLYSDWRIVLPSGEHPAIGIGGHIQGGAFGFLCRRHGLGVDFLYAVELLWVNESGQVKKTIATMEEDDANRELWWAHTGGGAGNFGVVTRYWFKTPGVKSNDPAHLLPKSPNFIETVEIDWMWDDINSENFQQLVSNFCNWSQQNAGYDSFTNSLFATLHLFSKSAGKIQVKAVLLDEERADEALRDFLHTLHSDLAIPHEIVRKKMSWLDFALHPFPDFFSNEKSSFKFKDAFLLEPYTSTQIRVMYQYLTSSDDTPGGFIGLATYGGKVNTLPSDTTATFQRKAILTTCCVAGWIDQAEEKKYIEWVRNCYHDLYIDTGGIPVPGKQTGGCIIAHPDNDLADPRWNKTAVAWYTLYYQDNYPRLQKVKEKWDPLNVFRHSLSVRSRS